MDQRGIYDKYEVRRVDGKPMKRSITIEIDKDPQAIELLDAIANVVESTRPAWANDLRQLSAEL
jgi:hypothetical protein